MLVKQAVKVQLAALMAQMSNYSEDDAQDKYADGLADIIINTIKMATVNVTVATTGTAAAQTGTGTGTLS